MEGLGDVVRWVAGVVGAPVGHIAEDGEEVAAFEGQFVAAICLDDDTVLLQAIEALTEHAGVDVTDGTLDLAVASRLIGEFA